MEAGLNTFPLMADMKGFLLWELNQSTSQYFLNISVTFEAHTVL